MYTEHKGAGQKAAKQSRIFRKVFEGRPKIRSTGHPQEETSEIGDSIRDEEEEGGDTGDGIECGDEYGRDN